VALWTVSEWTSPKGAREQQIAEVSKKAKHDTSNWRLVAMTILMEHQLTPCVLF
jgi:hypothetical protein